METGPYKVPSVKRATLFVGDQAARVIPWWQRKQTGSRPEVQNHTRLRTSVHG